MPTISTMGVNSRSTAEAHAGRPARGIENVTLPTDFGPFAKVWDELGIIDKQLCNLRNTDPHNAVRESSIDDLQAERETSKQEDTTADAENELEPSELTGLETLDIAPPQSSDITTQRRPSWAECNPTQAAAGRFSQVWDQLNSLDYDLRDSQKDAHVDPSIKLVNGTHRCPATDDSHSGILTVVTMAGDLVGEYEVAPGMTVSSLRDKIAHSRGQLPFTLTLLLGTVVLDNEDELSEIVRQSIFDGSPLTLLHSAPTVCVASPFSRVWDTLGQLSTSLDAIGESTPALV